MRDCGDFEIEIRKDGSWWHQGRPIARHNLARLFAGVLTRDDAGVYWLETPAERGRITVEDAPFVAIALETEGSGKSRRVFFRTNMDERVMLGPENPLRMAAGVPYVTVRGRLEARLLRPVYYQLATIIEEDSKAEGAGPGLWSGGIFHSIDIHSCGGG